MYEIIKEINDETKLGMQNGRIYILKKILFEDVPVFQRLASLKNENVIRTYETVRIENDFYAVQEFVQGETLEEHIRKNGLMNDEKIKEITLQLCAGLEGVHSLGIVHRDINPNNIMLSDDGKVKIIDFGISGIQKTGTGADTQLLGTHGFAAPEQYGFSRSGVQSDIYSVGAVMNYMKTGRLPSEVQAEGEFSSIILKCTQMDKNERYADVVTLAGEIEKKGKFKAFLRRIPGFRSDKVWKKTVALIYYLTAVLFIAVFETPYNLKNEVFTDLALFFLMIVPVPILADAGGYLEKWSFTKNKTERSKIFVQIFLTVVSLIIFCFFCTIS